MQTNPVSFDGKIGNKCSAIFICKYSNGLKNNKIIKRSRATDDRRPFIKEALNRWVTLSTALLI